MKPMLDPKKDLAGTTPEKLAKALLRRSVPSDGAKAVSDRLHSVYPEIGELLG